MSHKKAQTTQKIFYSFCAFLWLSLFTLSAAIEKEPIQEYRSRRERLAQRIKGNVLVLRAAADREVQEARRALAMEKERLAKEATEHHQSALAETQRLVEEAEERARSAEERASEASKQAAETRSSAQLEADATINRARREAEQIVNCIFDSMVDALRRGEGIEIRGFGSFTVREYKQYEGGATVHGRVTRCDPPRLLSYTWGEAAGYESEVTFELSEADGRVLLVLTHRRLDDRATMLDVAAGWHTHLGILTDQLEGRVPAPFWSAGN